MKFKVINIVFSISILTGCTTFNPSLSVEDKVSNDSGYVYGKFKQTGAPRFGIVIMNIDDRKTYTIEFEETSHESIKTYEVKPGEYKIMKVVYANADYMSKGEDLFTDERLTTAFAVEPKQAYYIGDYTAKTYYGTHFNGASIVTTERWALRNIEMNFKDTTIAFKKKYPNLNTLDTKQAIVVE